MLYVCIDCEENFIIKSEWIVYRFILNEGVLLFGFKVICLKLLVERVFNLCLVKLFG